MKKKLAEEAPTTGEMPQTAGAPETPAQAKAKKVAVVKLETVFTYQEPKPLAEGEKAPSLPKQAQQIVDIIKNGPISRADLLIAMTPVIETRQPIERILAFYQPRLIAGGYVTIEKVQATPATAPVDPEVPATE